MVVSAVILLGRTICRSQAMLHTTQPRSYSAGDGTNACILGSTNPTASGFGVPVVDQGDARNSQHFQQLPDTGISVCICSSSESSLELSSTHQSSTFAVLWNR